MLEAALGSEVRIAAAPAQPDARDAEIERLKEELEAATATIEDEQAAHEETRADAARLTKELEEAKTKLAHAENARDARQNEREEQRAKAAKANRRADAAEADAEALREALAKAPHAGDCAATTIKDYRWPVTMPHPQRIVTPRVPADEAKCDCWKSKALAPPEPKAETPAETAGQKEGR